jgi:methoxymalonate biosynthesis protein
MPDQLAYEQAVIGELVDGQPGAWDRAMELPVGLLRKLGAKGVLCAQVPASYGGLGASSRRNGELTAYVGSLCSSLRSIMTSQGIAAWTIQRFGDRDQRLRHLAELTSGQLAAVGFSESHAGSDLSAIQTEIRSAGDSAVLDGQKKWVTGSRYADLLLILGRHGDGGAFALVPVGTPGVCIVPVTDPLGCRAAGQAHILLDNVRLPAASILGGGGQSLPLLFTTALSYGRMSVAWGCTGIIRSCLTEATRHARDRTQSGQPLAQHQLVGRHLAELLAADQVCTRVCEHASDCWESSSPDTGITAMLAKYVCAGYARRGAATAVQVLASAGAQDGHAVARAYRDAKMMEIIEGSTEICQLQLAQYALSLLPG